MKKLAIGDFMRLRKLVFQGARPLEYTLWKLVFENGGRGDFLSVLASYQNEDGGFGHGIEANNWNPCSSPYVTDCAINYLDRAGLADIGKGHPIVRGIIKYLASGEHFHENGWAVSIPSNNGYSHAPWFHYDPQAGGEINVGLTISLANFILKYADSGGGSAGDRCGGSGGDSNGSDGDSDIYQKAAALKTKYAPEETAAKTAIPDFSNYDPAVYEPWAPSPASFAGSPEGERYPALKSLVDLELDAMVDRLRGTSELSVMHDEDIEKWEKRVPRADGKKWNDSEQIIGSFFWSASDYISQIETLKKFGRLDFHLPVLI